MTGKIEKRKRMVHLNKDKTGNNPALFQNSYDHELIGTYEESMNCILVRANYYNISAIILHNFSVIIHNVQSYQVLMTSICSTSPPFSFHSSALRAIL